MRLKNLYIKEFKNLKDFYIDFFGKDMTTVLIGRNGTGKSNLIESLVIIFRDLDLHNNPSFSYQLAYECNNYDVEIRANEEKKPYYIIAINQKEIPISKFYKDITLTLPQ